MTIKINNEIQKLWDVFINSRDDLKRLKNYKFESWNFVDSKENFCRGFALWD